MTAPKRTERPLTYEEITAEIDGAIYEAHRAGDPERSDALLDRRDDPRLKLALFLRSLP